MADAIVTKNVLQARNPATARRLTTLIRTRLETMGPELWKLVRDGKGTVAAHAVLAAAVKHSSLLGDFLEIVVAEIMEEKITIDWDASDLTPPSKKKA